MEKFEIFRTLGTGSFGRVLLCKEKQSGKYCALKMIKKDIVIRLKQVRSALWSMPSIVLRILICMIHVCSTLILSVCDSCDVD